MLREGVPVFGTQTQRVLIVGRGALFFKGRMGNFFDAVSLD